MKDIRIVLLGGLVLLGCGGNGPVPAHLHEVAEAYRKNPREANLEWFKDAEFGMFIHYGLYSQLEKGEWVQLTDTILPEDYQQLAASFDPANFDANAICDLAVRAGMKYITFTAKHHDGFCLFKTRQTSYNSWDSPAHRDLVGELARACSERGLGLFLYYSYAADWHHPYFVSREDCWINSRPAYREKPASYRYRSPEDFRRYIDFAHAQLTELLTQYPDIAGIWLDPIMGYYSCPDLFPIEETYALIRKLSPHALISFKQGANGDEDFAAPERNFGAVVGKEFPAAIEANKRNEGKLREICNTMQPRVPGAPGQTWGYNSYYDGKHLSRSEVLQLLQEADSLGANLLLNIGPLPDGTIPPEDVAVLGSIQTP